jgi:hypothetical protein
MKRFTLLVICSALVMPASATADWRWAPPTLEKKKVVFNCATTQCIKKSYKKALKRHKLRITHYNHRRLREWTHWTRLFIPACTWYGESGTGPEYAPYRYTTPNAGGSGAYGKFQMMPGTYHNRAKYHDWSALDQEIAARREYWANGTSPWTNCY